MSILDHLKESRRFLILAFAITVMITGCGEESNKENEIEKFTVQFASVTEENSNTLEEFTVSLEGSLVSDLTVPFEIIEGTAVIGDDVNTSGGEITFTPESQQAIIPIEIVGDEHFEIEETFSIRLTADGQPTMFTFTINDDDNMAEILSDADGFYTPENYPSMSLKWSDEFNGGGLNTGDWTYEIGNGDDGWGNRELQNYTENKENSTVENGMLTITALKDGSNYTSARIKTEDKVEIQYGRIDIRAKLPEGQGIWPAIWMLGSNIDQVGWPMSGEIDIMELVGHEPSIVHGTVHYYDDGYETSTGIKGLSSGTYSDQFHVYTLVWEKDQMRWYVDNQLFKTFSTSSPNVNFYPFNAPFFFIMNVAVGGNWPDPPDSTTEFPQEMVVDYIRVFE